MRTSDQSLVEKLTRSKIYLEYESAFRGALGLPLAFVPVESWGLPLREDRHESLFCALMSKANRTCAACLQLQAKLRIDAADEAASASCFSGLSESFVPVRLGAHLVGFLHTGQVFTRKPNEADFRKTLGILGGWGVVVNVGELRAAYFATRIVPPAQYQAIVSLLKVFAEQLAAMSNQILVTEESAENPQITRAREFIQRNMVEDIHVADGARMAHMSTFYFCKSFKRSTGLSFTEYLSRLRTERAKMRLLDPHMRVSEVAFEVGFQSLSQFNRVFKRVTGQCPNDYRHRLASTTSHAERAPAFGTTPPRRIKVGVGARPMDLIASTDRVPVAGA